MQSVYPLILCGGMGSRLWPLSRIDQPKQFQPVNGKGSLTYFQTTVQRHRGHDFKPPIVVTNMAQAGLVKQQLHEIQCDGLVIGEPVGRNTGPAVLAAALKIMQTDPSALLLVLPSDHIIVGDINATVMAMAPAAAEGRIVMFGVPPSYAETGYGYIMDGGESEEFPGLRSVAQFIEKPPLEIAGALIATDRAYWASGISLFRADLICAEFARLHPATHAAVLRAVEAGIDTLTSFVLDEAAFGFALDEPTERAVFEHSTAVFFAPIHVRWDDVGAWTAVFDVNPKTEEGNVTNGDVMTLGTTNSLIRTEDRLVVVIGMNDVIVVDTKDALLVTNRANAQQVKQVVETLKANNRTEVRSHPYHSRTWGGIEAISADDGYKMERLTVHPGASVTINGHGKGDSFLSVVAGEGIYMDHEGAEGQTVRLGNMVTIDRHSRARLTNSTTGELHAFLLSTVPPAALTPVVLTDPTLTPVVSSDA